MNVNVLCGSLRFFNGHYCIEICFDYPDDGRCCYRSRDVNKRPFEGIFDGSGHEIRASFKDRYNDYVDTPDGAVFYTVDVDSVTVRCKEKVLLDKLEWYFPELGCNGAVKNLTLNGTHYGYVTRKDLQN